jgi:hypothetical protein
MEHSSDEARGESILGVLNLLADVPGQRKGWSNGTLPDAAELLNMLLDDLQFEEFVDRLFPASQAEAGRAFVATVLSLEDTVLDDWLRLPDDPRWQEVGRQAGLVRAILASRIESPRSH